MTIGYAEFAQRNMGDVTIIHIDQRAVQKMHIHASVENTCHDITKKKVRQDKQFCCQRLLNFVFIITILA
jgi:hypothetical protein